MGFEQLAALKAQLAKQAEQSKPAGKPGRRPQGKALAQPPRERKGETEGAAAASANPARRTRSAPAKPQEAVDPVLQAIAKLQKRFPATFPRKPAAKRPLKEGIFQDLQAHAEALKLDTETLRDAIRTWCRGSRYWSALSEGAARIDLAGQEAGTVTAQAAAHARRLEGRRIASARARATAPKDGGAAPGQAKAEKAEKPEDAPNPAGAPSAAQAAQPVAAPDTVSETAPSSSSASDVAAEANPAGELPCATD